MSVGTTLLLFTVNTLSRFYRSMNSTLRVVGKSDDDASPLSSKSFVHIDDKRSNFTLNPALTWFRSVRRNVNGIYISPLKGSFVCIYIS